MKGQVFKNLLKELALQNKSDIGGRADEILKVTKA